MEPLLQNSLFRKLLEIAEIRRSESLATLINSDPLTDASAIARAQGSIALIDELLSEDGITRIYTSIRKAQLEKSHSEDTEDE